MKLKTYLYGDIRIKSFFAWFPITIGRDTRWLERVTVEQKFIEDHVSILGEYFPAYWDNIQFL